MRLYVGVYEDLEGVYTQYAGEVFHLVGAGNPKGIVSWLVIFDLEPGSVAEDGIEQPLMDFYADIHNLQDVIGGDIEDIFQTFRADIFRIFYSYEYFRVIKGYGGNNLANHRVYA